MMVVLLYKICCVEDDALLANELKTALERFNYEVILIDDFKKVYDIIILNKPDLILMDVNLPYQDGIYWTGQIRRSSDVPILFISSRTDRIEKLMAMGLGADDYLSKPIDLELTLMKVQAILRRTYNYDMSSDKNVIAYNGLTLDLKKFEISYNNDFVALTKNELKILDRLINSQGKFVQRDELMKYLWDNESFIDDNAFNTNISRLRKKLEQLIGKNVINNKRNVGYSLEI
jgi:two-component system response regulator protein BraR/BceR